jgi:hypothetical protein
MTLSKKLKKWFYIESKTTKTGMEFMVWSARFTTIPIFGLRYTVIYGLDFEIFADMKSADDYLKIQKMAYKIALLSKYRR